MIRHCGEIEYKMDGEVLGEEMGKKKKKKGRETEYSVFWLLKNVCN